MARGMHVCSFSQGTYTVNSPSGRTGLLFDDSDQFGPSKVHPRTGDLTEISERLRWFWTWYPGWRQGGRPTIGRPISSPIGPIARARGPALIPGDPS